MLILGVIGRKGSGKDAVGEHLCTRGFTRIAYADLVKTIALVLFPHLTHRHLWGPIEVKEAVDPVTGKTPRWILQKLGTEVGRQGQLDVFEELGVTPAAVAAALSKFHVEPGQTAWIDALFENLDDGDFVVTDVRFPNEAEAILDRGGHVIKLVRPGFDTGTLNDHPSETEVENCRFDRLVPNDGTLADLYERVDAVLTYFRSNA